MILRRRVIPDRLAQMWGLSAAERDAFARKESLDCCWCGAKLRGRRIAGSVLNAFSETGTRSIAKLVRLPAAGAWLVAEINLIDGLHEQLLNLAGLSYSEFLPGTEPGATRDGARCEDLTRLTYESSRFDLVLTSETLEHVPDPAAALREIHRVLKPGGFHICTIPRRPGIARTYARARLGVDGVIEPIDGVLLHHPGGDWGYPVFTEFGDDFEEIVRGHGFEVRVEHGHTRETDVCQVFVCRKL